MRHWASTIPDVQFLEVCVESKAVALHFHRTFGFGENEFHYSSSSSSSSSDNHNNFDSDEEALPPVINGWIPSRHYMPVGFGQLGCSGFVVSDANGKFVSRKTKAYLQFGEDAFRHVELFNTTTNRGTGESDESDDDDDGKSGRWWSIHIGSLRRARNFPCAT